MCDKAAAWASSSIHLSAPIRFELQRMLSAGPTVGRGGEEEEGGGGKSGKEKGCPPACLADWPGATPTRQEIAALAGRAPSALLLLPLLAHSLQAPAHFANAAAAAAAAKTCCRLFAGSATKTLLASPASLSPASHDNLDARPAARSLARLMIRAISPAGRSAIVTSRRRPEQVLRCQSCT